jgi:hypothetical protein
MHCVKSRCNFLEIHIKKELIVGIKQVPFYDKVTHVDLVFEGIHDSPQPY